ncbi:hypothetical protein KKC74_02815 [bacterium]|nr:hypothetical protein [bacterium]MBU1873378.1 hypothetical protein [bacterium]
MTNQLKLNSWRPESERIKIANNEELNVLNNAKVILYQWFSEQQIDPSPFSGIPTIKLQDGKDRKTVIKHTYIDDTQPSIHPDGKYVEFKKEKDNVIVTYNNRTRSYKTDGFKYLYQLFYNPNKEIYSSKLYEIIHYRVLNIENDEIIDQEDNIENDEYDDYRVTTVDDIAKEEYKSKLNLLNKGMQEAEINEDMQLYLKYEKDYNKLKAHILKLYGKNGRPRELNKVSDNHRRNIQRAIKAALERIEKDFPDIYKSLYSSIKTGVYCQYNPNDNLKVVEN